MLNLSVRNLPNSGRVDEPSEIVTHALGIIKREVVAVVTVDNRPLTVVRGGWRIVAAVWTSGWNAQIMAVELIETKWAWIDRNSVQMLLTVGEGGLSIRRK
jgi:hypothetical protein